jgi:hypothetical protein
MKTSEKVMLRSVRRGATAAARDGVMLIKRGVQKRDKELVILGSFLCGFAASAVRRVGV